MRQNARVRRRWRGDGGRQIALSGLCARAASAYPARVILRFTRRTRYAAGLAVALILTTFARATPYAQVPGTTGNDALSAAQHAEHNGDITAALAGYRALAASPAGQTAALGNLGLGRVLERTGDPVDAIGPLQATRATLGTTPDGLRATFLIGEAQADSGANDAAASSFQSYIAGGGPASKYAAIERAWALQAENDDADALTALGAPLQSPSNVIRRVALRAASLSHERLQDFAQAAADQQAIVDSKAPSTESATALLEEARLLTLAGDGDGAQQKLLALIQLYPASGAAPTALDRLDVLGATVDPLQRALVQYGAGRNDAAHTTLQNILAGNPDADLAATATYYLGRIADRQDRNDDALDDYAQAQTLAPEGPHAADALWYRAELLRYLGRSADAQAQYAALAQQYPQSTNAGEAAFDAGLMAYLGGHASDAASAWSTLAQSSDPVDAARADLWLAKLALGNGDRSGAATDLARAQAVQPVGYFGLRAALLASGGTASLGGGAVNPLANDWTAVEQWLTVRNGPENSAQFQALQASDSWREGVELAALGWTTQPPLLIDEALGGAGDQPWALYRAARLLSGVGLTSEALFAADSILNPSSSSQQTADLTVPAALLRLAYPLDYADLFNADGAQNGLDPLLLAALTRQESGFDPAAGSGAGALGLTQLVPSTAQDVATSLGLGSVGPTDLRRPLLNLRLGAAYLAAQAKAQDGDLARALAAYNGGGGNASRWAKQSGNDPDLFYETVDFSETRAYIRLVEQNYAIYTYLYRGTPRPALPHG